MLNPREYLKPEGEVLLEKQAEVVHFLGCEHGIPHCVSFT
jgi:hypothetical protein